MAFETAAPKRNEFQLARERVSADVERQRKRDVERTQRLGASRGQRPDVAGSPIQRRLQQEEAQRREAEARSRGLIDIEELQQREREKAAETQRQFVSQEAAREREALLGSQREAQRFAGEQAGLSRELERERFGGALGLSREQLAQQQRQFEAGQTLSREELAQSQQQFQAGLEQSLNLASRGLGIQEQAQELQRQGMDADNAFRNASLAQSKSLADQGFTLEQMKLDFAREGQTIQNNQFLAELEQSKNLAQQGFTLEQSAQALQRAGLTQEQAQFQANLGFQTAQNELNRDQQIRLARLDERSQANMLRLQNTLQNETIRLQDKLDDENVGVDRETALRNIFITEAIAGLDPEDPNFGANLNEIATKLGVNLPAFNINQQTPAGIQPRDQDIVGRFSQTLEENPARFLGPQAILSNPLIEQLPGGRAASRVAGKVVENIPAVRLGKKATDFIRGLF